MSDMSDFSNPAAVASVSPRTSSLARALADRYRIERELGAGGMATVYLAHDLRHDRPVAIKVLRPELAAAVGVERFLSEIKTTANLQHAHILGLIDSGAVEGTVYYVMPYIDGESLRQRLTRETQLAVPEATRIAVDVARALDYAHRRGVIHRDIKPENILLHEGQPLVADFGIALAVTRSTDGTRITESGMSLGTPQYMSPEQAMGERTLDARADVYALGCVLYEMLTGEPPFTGPTAQTVITKLMTVEPAPVSTLRRSTPSNVAAATMTALNKVPADRFATAADFAAALENPLYTAPAASGKAARSPRRAFPYLRGGEWAALAAIAVLAAAAIAGWARAARRGADVTARFEIPVPDSAFGAQVVLSPDGRRLIWSARSGYYERWLDSLGIRKLRDATPNSGPVRGLSPDGANALASGRGGVSAIPLAGGAARSLTAAGGRSGAWGTDGYVYFAFADPASPVRGLARVRAEGGAVDTLVKFDAIATEICVLPRGRGLIVGLIRNGASELDAFDLRKKTLKPLGVSGSFAQFVEPGYVLFARGASIWGAPFDMDRLAFSRPPAAFLDVPSGGVTHLATSADVLVYVPVPEQSGSSLVTRSIGGATVALPNIPDTLRFTRMALSPDGQRLAMQGAPPQTAGSAQNGPPPYNLYVYELATGRVTRLRSDDRDQAPAWLPNGRELSFVRVSTDTPTTSVLMRRTWDGSSIPVAMLSRPGGGRGAVLGPMAWLPNGQVIVRVAGRPSGGRGAPPGDLMRLSPDNPAKLDTVVATEYAESEPAVSPDGRLLAFTSDESGRVEVFVRPVAGGTQRRVSLNGGTMPRFAHSGRDLFYVNGDTLFAAPIVDGRELIAGQVKPILVSRNIGLGYAVLPGDTTFITPAPPRTGVMVVVTNYVAALDRLFSRR